VVRVLYTGIVEKFGIAKETFPDIKQNNKKPKVAYLKCIIFPIILA
jgi:hypothetical protein